MITPNNIQQEAILSLNKSVKAGKNKFLVVLPSGLGKTIYSSLIAKSHKGNILYVVHRREILDQAMKEFEKCGHDKSEFGVLAGQSKKLNKRYLFATIQSLTKIKTLNKFNKNHFEFIIVDEWHHAASPSYEGVLRYFKNYKLLGITATPYRLDGKDIFKPVDNNVIYNMDIAEGITGGYLSSFKYTGLYDNIDYSNIKWKNYRYRIKDLNRRLLIDERDNKVIKEFKARIGDKQTIGFCISIEHAERCVRKFRDAGITAECITWKVERTDRNRIIDDFRNKRVQVIFTRDIFNEGVDFPNVEGLLFLRPTISKNVFLQQLGRGLRKMKGKPYVTVLDFIGNYVNAWRTRQIVVNVIERTNTLRHKKPIYNYKVPKVFFESQVIDLFEKQEQRIINRDKLIAEYFRLKETLKRTPKYSDFKVIKGIKNSKYEISSYMKYFGTWDNFLKEISEVRNRKEEIATEYRKLKKKLGRIPKVQEYRKIVKYGFGYVAVQRHFGGYRGLLEYVGDHHSIGKFSKIRRRK